MISDFIKLRIRETTRSSAWNKSVVINIIMGFIMLYLMISFMMVGFVLDRILGRSFPDSDPVTVLNRGLIYYFGIELLVRFFMQQTPAMSIAPLLHLPVRRSSLMHFLLARSVVNPLNYISFLIFIPFAIRVVSVYYSAGAACVWLLALFLMIQFVIFINVYIKRQLIVRPIVTLLFGMGFLALIVSDYLGILPISGFSALLFDSVLVQPGWILAPVALVAGVYLLNFRFLLACAYPEEIDRNKSKKQVAVQSLGFISRFGQIGELIGVELKLMLRHKRTKSYMSLMLFFLIYGLMFYPHPQYGNSMPWLIFIATFMTGSLMLTYGQFIIAWEGKFFDGILTRNGSFFTYFRAKYYMMVMFCLICYVLTTPYVFFGMKILWIQTACFLFNIGVSAFIILWFARFNSKRIELARGSAFNWQGTGVSQFIFMLPTLVLPILLASIFVWLDLEVWLLLGGMAAFGVIGVLCHNRILQMIFRQIEKKKYSLAEGYRKN